MLIEAVYNFPVGYIGGTWDAQVNLFVVQPAETWIGLWDPGFSYVADQDVVGSDGNLYVAVSPSQGADPTIDDGTDWLLGTPYNLTGYTAQMPIGSPPIFTLTSVSGGGLTLGGTAGSITIKASNFQTLLLGTRNVQTHYYIQLTDAGGDIYFPLGGTIAWVFP